MAFEPINDDHSVDVCQFAVGLTASITTQTIAALQRHHPLWMNDLPAESLVSLDDFSGEAITVLRPPRTQQAYMAAFLKPDGSPLWALRVYANQIDLTCSRYTRWVPTWGLAQAVLSRVLGVIAEHGPPGLKIAAAGHRIIDQFATQPGYRLDELFERESVLPPYVFDVGDHWHCHTGWFEDAERRRDLLNLSFNVTNQAIISSMDKREHRLILSVAYSIQHRFVVEAEQDTSGAPELTDSAQVNEWMNTFHEANKRFLGRLLKPDMSEAIGLSGRPSAVQES
jgi:uncharacterized protein (TIGR04255 family)